MGDGMKDIVGTIGKYIGDFSKEDQSTVYTPMNIAEEMVNLLPDDIFKPDKKFIDIACKSGRFLLAIYNRLMSSPYMGNIESEQRSKWILDNQLYAIALTEISSVLIRKSLYDDYTVKGNIILINSYTDKIKKNSFGQNANGSVKTLKVLLSEEFNQVNFDVVIGNPPYNNDIYLDFVTQGFTLIKDIGFEVMITPAKWQAKGGKKNEDFRKDIVPHMSKIVYYIDAGDIFDIREMDGITYYSIDRFKHEIKKIENRCGRNKMLNSTVGRKLSNADSLNNFGNAINQKLQSYKKFKFNRDKSGKHKVVLIDAMNFPGKRIVDTTGRTLMFPPISISQMVIGNESCVFSSESKAECVFFISWIETKLIKFLVFINTIGYNGLFDDLHFKFVPDPGPFDHIFTDAELYKKYNLTPEEINIIESVIKERK